MFNTKNVKYGAYSAALIAVVIAIVFVINTVAGMLPDSLNKVDLTANKLYSISEETRNVLKDLDQDVTMTVLAPEDKAEDMLVRVLNKYESASDKITVEYVDPTINMDMADKYKDLTAGSVIVKSENRERTVDLNSIFPADYDSYYSTGQVSYNFDGEGQLTSAIAYVTSGNLSKLYTVTGHGESSLGSLAVTRIEQQNLETAELNLMAASSIPEDCDCLLINAPQSDYTEAEAGVVLDYLRDGGKVIVLSAYAESALTNFNSILDAYGITVNEGIVMEGSNHYYQYPIYVIGTLQDSDITSGIMNSNTNILVPYALGYTLHEAENIETTELMTTSSGAYLKTPGDDGSFATLEKEDGDAEGTYDLAVLATGSSSLDEDNAAGELIAISAASLIDDNVNQSFGVGNLDLFMSCVAHMCSNDETTMVSIPSKSLSSAPITVPQMHTLLWALITVIIIPLAVLIAGLVIWLKRRKK